MNVGLKLIRAKSVTVRGKQRRDCHRETNLSKQITGEVEFRPKRVEDLGRCSKSWIILSSHIVVVVLKIAYKLSRFLAACETMQYSGIGISAILASPWGAAFASERPVRSSKKIVPKL